MTDTAAANAVKLNLFIYLMTGRYKRASHFVSQRWLWLLNTDNIVAVGAAYLEADVRRYERIDM